MWKQSQRQQNMQTISETPAEVFARIQNELNVLLQAAAGEGTGSRHSHIGRWRQRVSELIAEASERAQQSAQPAQAAPKPYKQAARTGVAQAIGVGTDLIFNTAGTGDIPYNPATGVFSLSANKAYRLTAHLLLGNFSGETVNVAVEWVDSVTNAVLEPNQNALCTPTTNTNSIAPQPTAEVMHSTSVAQGVKCRVTATLGTADLLTAGSYAIVQEI